MLLESPLEQEENKAENLFEKIMIKQIRNLVERNKSTHSRIFMNSKQDKNQRKKNTYIYYNLAAEIQGKEMILKADRENDTYGENDSNIHRLLKRNNGEGAEDSGKTSFICSDGNYSQIDLYI